MRKYLPYIAIILIGITISVYSYTRLSLAANGTEEGIKIVVPTEDIPAYKEITPSDLEFKVFPKNEVNEDTVTDPQFLIGKQASSRLYKGWPINEKALEVKKKFKDKHIVTINIDKARSAGAKEGDIVDVYFVPSASADTNSTIQWSERVASEVIVLAIDTGSNKETSLNVLGTATLAVDKNSTHKLVPGATKDNDRYVLAIRQDIVGEPVQETSIATILNDNSQAENTKVEQ